MRRRALGDSGWLLALSEQGAAWLWMQPRRHLDERLRASAGAAAEIAPPGRADGACAGGASARPVAPGAVREAVQGGARPAAPQRGGGRRRGGGAQPAQHAGARPPAHGRRTVLAGRRLSPPSSPRSLLSQQSLRRARIVQPAAPGTAGGLYVRSASDSPIVSLWACICGAVLQDKLWSSLKELADQVAQSATAVWHLQRVVAKKKVRATGTPRTRAPQPCTGSGQRGPSPMARPACPLATASQAWCCGRR